MDTFPASASNSREMLGKSGDNLWRILSQGKDKLSSNNEINLSHGPLTLTRKKMFVTSNSNLSSIGIP